MTEPKPPSEEKRTHKQKITDTLNKLKEKSSFNGMSSYISSNKRDALAYVVLVVGLIFLFFRPFIGELLIGAVFGIYFSSDIISLWNVLDEHIEQQGMVRSLVIAATLLAFFIAAPGIFIAAAVVVTLKLLISAS